MRFLFAFVIAVHGLLHLLGTAKAFGVAELPQLTQPISRPLGLLWLAAALLTLAAALTALAWPRHLWLVGGAAALLSQVVICSAWHDARFGTLANALLLVAAALSLLTQGPGSLRAEFARAIVPPAGDAATLTEADLAPLPAPVRRYIEATGFVGRPRVRAYHLRFQGRIRSGPRARWMPFTAEQESYTSYPGPPARYFLMDATMMGAPMQALHRLALGHATMRVKALGALTVVDASGPSMDQSEAVTLLNDLCILAPGALVSPDISWQPIDERSAVARLHHGGRTVSATLYFGEDGLLRDFVSEDRLRSSPDGRTFTRTRFSTPVRGYRAYGPYRLAQHGEARWDTRGPEGEFAYGEFELLAIRFE